MEGLKIQKVVIFQLNYLRMIGKGEEERAGRGGERGIWVDL